MNIFEWEKQYVNCTSIYEVNDLVSENTAEEMIKELKKALAGENIILWGAGTVGRVFYLLLKELEISVEYVVDVKGGEISFLDGIEVLSIDDNRLKEKLQDSLIIATVNRNLYEDVKKDILNVKGNLAGVVCGHSIHMVAQGALCMSKACDIDKVINLANCYECTNLDNTCMSLNKYLKRINGFKDEDKGTKAVKMIGYALSNICTLRCKNCCELVPYMPIESRHFVSGKNVIKDILKLSEACNFLTLLEFIGGEPFLHPDLVMILRKVITIKNIGIIHIFTNGTVVPGDELCEVLRNDRITVYLSNYQATLEENFIHKIEETEEKLKRFGVNYFFGKKQSWMDFSSYDLVKSDNELNQSFEDCFLHNCNRLQDGILYVCPHQYAGIKLGKLKEAGETIHIYDYTDVELGEKLEELKQWKAIDACRYCTMPYRAKTVISGEQLQDI